MFFKINENSKNLNPNYFEFKDLKMNYSKYRKIKIEIIKLMIRFEKKKKKSETNLKTGRRRPEISWTQRSGSSATESLLLLLLLLVRSSDGSSSENKPNGRVWLIWAWWRARAKRAPAAYLWVGVKNDVVVVAAMTWIFFLKKRLKKTFKAFVLFVYRAKIDFGKNNGKSLISYHKLKNCRKM